MAAPTPTSTGIPEPRPASCRVVEGSIGLFFAFDVGHQVSLDRCRDLLAGAGSQRDLPSRRGSPSYFAYEPPPLRIEQGEIDLELGGVRLRGAAEASIFDFGAISIAFRFPFAGDLTRVLPLARAASENAEILRNARARAQELVGRLGAAIERPHLGGFVEDYFIFKVGRFEEDLDASALLERYGPLIAQALRFEREELSEQEVESALKGRISYSPSDLVIVDWSGAFVYDRDAEDTEDVLAFANIELLELRWLDRNLDRALSQAYDTLDVATRRFQGYFRPYARAIDQVSRLQLESTAIFERIDNALKLIGEQYLARVYDMAARRMHLGEWQQDVARKIEFLGEVYTRLNDRANAARSEILEWIIIGLIVIEIVTSFLKLH